MAEPLHHEKVAEYCNSTRKAHTHLKTNIADRGDSPSRRAADFLNEHVLAWDSEAIWEAHVEQTCDA